MDTIDGEALTIHFHICCTVLLILKPPLQTYDGYRPIRSSLDEALLCRHKPYLEIQSEG